MLDIKKTIANLPQQSMAIIVVLLPILAIIPAWINYDIIARDGARLYVSVAKLFLEGQFHKAFFDSVSVPLLPIPLYEILIAGCSMMFGFDLEMSGRVVSVISFIIGAIGIYKVTEIVFNNRIVSLLTLLFFVCNSELVVRSVDCLKESLLIALIVWGNYFILKGLYSSTHRAICFTGGAFLFFAGGMVRSTSLIFLGAWLIIWVFYKRQGLLLRFIIFALPLVGVVVFWYFNPYFPFFRNSYALEIIFSRGMLGFVDTLKAGLCVVNQFIARTHYALALFGFLGFRYYSGKKLYPIHVALVLGLFLIICVRTGWQFFEFDSDRYLLAPIMWFYPMAGYSIARSMASANKALKIFAVLTILSCPVLWADKAFAPPDPDKLARKESGQLILSQIGPNQEIISNELRIAFYAKGKLVPFANAQNIENLKHCVAIDVKSKTEEGDGEKAKEILDKAGVKPDKVFGRVHVYFPRS